MSCILLIPIYRLTNAIEDSCKRLHGKINEHVKSWLIEKVKDKNKGSVDFMYSSTCYS